MPSKDLNSSLIGPQAQAEEHIEAEKPQKELNVKTKLIKFHKYANM